MNELLLLAFVCLSNIACFIVGAKVGQKEHPAEGIKPVIPVEKVKVKSFKESQEVKKQQEAVEDMLHNIEVYDGTSLGQRDIRL